MAKDQAPKMHKIQICHVLNGRLAMSTLSIQLGHVQYGPYFRQGWSGVWCSLKEVFHRLHGGFVSFVMGGQTKPTAWHFAPSGQINHILTFTHYFKSHRTDLF